MEELGDSHGREGDSCKVHHFISYCFGIESHPYGVLHPGIGDQMCIRDSNVALYATNVVITSIFPASLPISAMAGVTSPRIISGMMKPKNSLKDVYKRQVGLSTNNPTVRFINIALKFLKENESWKTH